MSTLYLSSFLATHSTATLYILIAGAFVETFFATSFLVPGEVFFIAGGAMAADGTLSLPLVVATLTLAGIAGDTASYCIGRIYGKAIFLRAGTLPLLRRICTPKVFARGRDLFTRHGVKSVFLARFLGPLSWIMPLIAGTLAMPYKKFALSNAVATPLAIGQFIAIGYYGTSLIHFIHNGDTAHLITTGTILLAIILLWSLFMRHIRQITRNST